MTTLQPPRTDPAPTLAEATDLGQRLVDAVRRAVVGKDRAVADAVGCVLAAGHLLVDDVPGVGKTLLAQALAAGIGGSFRRVQGTPDLLPGDVVGAIVPDDAGGRRLRFRPGPVFANVVVFDEVNRTSPRTQAALLEAAEERQVTVDGVTHPLPAPFVLVATQNPVESAGTFPLGEGALDRFAFALSLGRVDHDTERAVLLGAGGRQHLADVEPVTDPPALLAAQRAVREVGVAEAVADYVVRLLHASREHPQVRLGASTRAGVALVRLAQARALLDGRGYVTPADVQALAAGALAHRLVLVHGTGLPAARAVVEELLATVAVPRP